jgi:hypothetical protein
MPDHPCRRAARKRPDTVGELKSAEICVPHMPSLKVTDCEFQIPQKARRLIIVYPSSFIP